MRADTRQSGAQPDPPVTAERLAGREEGRQAALGELADKVADLQKRAEAAEAHSAQCQRERDTVQNELAKARREHEQSLTEMREQLENANERLSTILGGALTFESGPQTWEQALKACDGNYAEAARAYPELRKKYEAENRQK